MRNPFKKKNEQVVTARRQIRQHLGAAYDPTDPAVIARNKRMADKLRADAQRKAQ